jgi:hypothetical protein
MKLPPGATGFNAPPGHQADLKAFTTICYQAARAIGATVTGSSLTFTARSGWHPAKVSDQSTGYYPDPDCWPAAAAALDRLGMPHPGGFTAALIFRRCTACGERNIVRDGDFVRALCDSALPLHRNFDPA